ncbi:MAG: aspartate--tRNA ligase [Ignavibacteriales bacterium]|nr:aspartate--tRNA ligase [Ignavibacteriales bacterium]
MPTRSASRIFVFGRSKEPPVTYKKRTHTCGELRKSEVGKTATLTGWVDSRRDLGGVIFIDLRDRYGKTQVVFAPQHNAEAHSSADVLRSEFVLSVTGKVAPRPAGTENPDLPTGEIDIEATELNVLNKAETPPFQIEEESEASEDIRLKYRYLDLRRPNMQRNLLMRHKTYQAVRSFYDRNGFVEIETPILMKSTPEGARDYLVPSRIHRGKFFALPQSPQTYKQILMVSGFDRYFQIVKCFRDEDFRADRQAEFTQIDVEMSFVDEADVIAMTEGCIADVFDKVMGTKITAPFPRMSYREAMETYGSDKPNTGFGLKIKDCSSVVATSSFRVFSDAVKKGGVVAGICIPGLVNYTRNQLDGLTDYVKSIGAGGLVYMKMHVEKIENSVEKFVSADESAKIAAAVGAQAGDLVLIISGAWQKALTILGSLRLEMANRLKLVTESSWNFLWVLDFPLLEFSEEEKRFVSVHHPFTSPKEEDVSLIEKDPSKVRARAYDLVLNGTEIAGGSIRIHHKELQSKVFSLLGIADEEAKKKFGFLLEAFKYGAPPHGGIAYGFDRLVMMMAGEDSIRDVIAFPKTSSAMSLMDDSPSEVAKKQLDELHIRIV